MEQPAGEMTDQSDMWIQAERRGEVLFSELADPSPRDRNKSLTITLRTGKEGAEKEKGGG